MFKSLGLSCNEVACKIYKRPNYINKINKLKEDYLDLISKKDDLLISSPSMYANILKDYLDRYTTLKFGYIATYKGAIPIDKDVRTTTLKVMYENPNNIEVKQLPFDIEELETKSSLIKTLDSIIKVQYSNFTVDYKLKARSSWSLPIIDISNITEILTHREIVTLLALQELEDNIEVIGLKDIYETELPKEIVDKLTITKFNLYKPT